MRMLLSAPPGPPSTPGGGWCRFLRGFLDQPRDVASVVPSSRILRRELSSLPCVRSAGKLVELGPGMGEITRSLLDQIPSDARLLGIEIVPRFVQYLQEIPDPRLSVVEATAQDIDTELTRLRVSNPDVILSGIPFSTMSRQEGRELIRKIHLLLAPGGSFVAYQFRHRVVELANGVFGLPQRSFVLWNLPPLFIYQWRKPAATMPSHPSVEERSTRIRLRHSMTTALPARDSSLSKPSLSCDQPEEPAEPTRPDNNTSTVSDDDAADRVFNERAAEHCWQRKPGKQRSEIATAAAFIVGGIAGFLVMR